jgi:hypothetical protein
LSALLWTALAQPGSSVEPAHAYLVFRSAVQDKNFYFLSLIERTAAVDKAVRSDAALAKLAESKRAALANALSSCATAPTCYADAMKFSESEIATAADSWKRLYGSNPAVRSLADGAMRESGAFVRDQALAGADLLAKAWSDAAHGMNGAIDVYGTGHPPRYPAIDSVSYDVKSDTYGRLVRTVVTVLEDGIANRQLFFQPTLGFALGLMEANHRDEAGRFEPLDTGENRAAMRRAAAIDWNKFPYSVIVVPGSGNETEPVALSAWGKLRLTIAERRFRAGKAPFILVSGGFVHPNQTAHCEAIEMKRSLMADFGVPEDAILIDPHARHTTTNLRNAVRELYRYGFPFGKAALVSTDQDQSVYIEGAEFAKRCTEELGYLPALSLRRVSPFDLEFTPNIQSLQFDARDPLDP